MNNNKNNNKGLMIFVYCLSGVATLAVICFIVMMVIRFMPQKSEEKLPVDEPVNVEPIHNKPVVTEPNKTTVSDDTDDSIVSKTIDNEPIKIDVEKYVKDEVRPCYNEIKAGMDDMHQVNSNGIKWYCDSEERIRMVRYSIGVNENEMGREYYFDENDNLVFAFAFNGTEEHRFYFYDDTLVRYIDEYKRTTDYPKQDEILDMAEFMISEAYVYWD